MDKIPNKTRRLLKAANWDRLWRQCLLYAAYEERRYQGLPHRCHDIVQTAVEKTFSGERTWNPEICDLQHHLKMTIKSLYNNAYGRRQSRLKHARLSQTETAITASPARVQEDLDYLRKAIGLLKKHDPELATFFMTACHHLTRDCDTDKEVARAMKIAPSTFTKTKARISRIVGAWDNRPYQEQKK